MTGLLVIIAIVAIIVLYNKNKNNSTSQTAKNIPLDDRIINETTCDIGKMLALCDKASGSYIGIFCAVQNGNIQLRAQLRDGAWAYAIAHENDRIGQSSTNYWESLLDQFDGVIKQCNERHPELQMGAFESSCFHIELMPDWDDGISIEKLIYLPGSSQGYLSAIKSRVEATFSEYAGIRISYN